MVKRYAASVALVAILMVGSASAQTDRAADKAAVEKTVKEFITSFSTNDTKKGASFIHEPWMQIGIGKVVLNTAEAEKVITDARNSLTKDYDHFNFKQLSGK